MGAEPVPLRRSGADRAPRPDARRVPRRHHSNGRLFLLRAAFHGDPATRAPLRHTWYASTAKGSYGGNPRGGFDGVRLAWSSRESRLDPLGNGSTQHRVIVRLWPLAALTAALPLVRLRRALRRRRAGRPGVCRR